MKRVLCAAAALLAIAAGACCSIPTYTPAFWNNSIQIRSNNNCYNYSNNKRTDTFAQPGRAAGATWTVLECNNVRTAAVADGLVAVAGPNNCPKKECTLALVVDPGTDYHWYRRDQNGMWTHKPGGTPATNLDNSSNPIPNPETADRGGYTDFCGYLCSCSRSTEGNGRENIN
jgi:hypothetical protein